MEINDIVIGNARCTGVLAAMYAGRGRSGLRGAGEEDPSMQNLTKNYASLFPLPLPAPPVYVAGISALD